VRTVFIISIILAMTVSCDISTDTTGKPPELYLFFSPCGDRVPPDDEWIGFTERNDRSDPLSRYSIAYCCVECDDDGLTSGFPLISTDSTIVVGMGSGVLPCLEGLSGVGDSVQAVWLGLNPPEQRLPDHITGWWAEPDSFIASIMQEALDDTTSEDGLIVVGYNPGKQSLKVVRDSENEVQFVNPVSLSSGSRAVFAAYPDRSVLILEPPPSLVTLAGSRLYWVAECPLLEPDNTVVSLEMDWQTAIGDILRYMRGEGGPEPGPTLGSYLRLVRHGEDL